MTKLMDLWLGGNKLTALPSEVGSMSNLVLLSLFQNQLTSLPPTLANLKYLAILGINGNPMSITQEAALKTMLPKTSII
jgi:Leucine-rich repeat (LRR) protein